MQSTTRYTIWYGARNIGRRYFGEEEVRGRAEQLIKEICEEYGVEIEEMEVAVDHVHMLLSFPPKHSMGEVVRIIKSISARELFREFPRIKKRLCAGELWEEDTSPARSETV